MKEITPEGFRCAMGSCPALYELDDGRVLVVGERATPQMLARLIEAGRISPITEYGVIVERGMLGELAIPEGGPDAPMR